MLRHIHRFATIAAIAALLSACGEGEQPAAQAGGAAPAVPVAEPLLDQVADWDAFSGRFEAPDSVAVRARVSGYLEAAHFEDGQQVDEGDPLFTIDARPYRAAMEAAQGAVAQARAQLSLAERNLARSEELREARAASQEELETNQSALEQARAALDAAEARQRAAALDMEFTEVTAPVAGRVSERRVDPGNLVTAGGDVLTTVVSVDPIHFAFEAPESSLLNYQRRNVRIEGAPIEIRLAGEDSFSRQGRVTFADNAVDPSTGTIRLRAEVPNPDGYLRPGMFGDARMRGSEPYQAVLAPQTAILSDATRRLVYVVNEDNVVQPRTVSLGPPSGDFRVVRSGLEPGERIVISGLLGVQPGMTVDPQLQTLERAPQAAPAAPAAFDGATAAAALPVGRNGR